MAGLGAQLMDACRELVSDLQAAGVSASLERTATDTPGVWVSPQTVDVRTLSGDGTARVHLNLVVSDSGDVDAHEALCALLDDVLDTPVFGAHLVPAEPVDTSWALVIRDTPLPAYRLAVDIDLGDD